MDFNEARDDGVAVASAGPYACHPGHKKTVQIIPKILFYAFDHTFLVKRLVKAKFHYASWFEAGRKPAAS